MDGLGGLGVIVPGENHVVRFGCAGVLGGTEESDEFSVGAAIAQSLDEGEILE
ncbi:MAG: hypothetical protein RI897_1368 [Verrucomicrobiota bacterium]